MKSIETILSTYGFETRPTGTQVWGIGSLVWGHLMYVTRKGTNVFEVRYHTWYYDPDMEPVYDTEETYTMYGAEVLEFAFSHLGKYLFRGMR